jgi:hypothetical protein
LLLAILILTIIGVEWSKKPLASALLVWTDWFFAAYWYGWLVLCALNLFFWLASDVCLLRIKRDSSNTLADFGPLASQGRCRWRCVLSFT